MMLTPSTILGARLGAYEVQAVIGSGGMATVYRAFDHNLQRLVALKVLSNDVAIQPGFAERFRQEARLIARLRHPNIVQVYDFGQVDHVHYMVQELLPGPTLDVRIAAFGARGQPMPRREIVAVLQQLAAALDAAHAAGIIHRDVKPSNALYNADDALVLTDFGIAKTMLGDGTQTQTGVVLGTPVYVSPEQARGEPLTPASDIYALGVVLYELIGGRPPFDAPTPLAVILKHLQEPPPPLQSLRASISPAVEIVVQRALAKQPDDRYATAGDLARALEQAWPGQRALSAPPADIHSVPTTAWQPPHAAAVALAPAAHPIAAPPVPRAPAPVVALPQPARAPARRRDLRAGLAVALAAILLGGMMLVWWGARAPASSSSDAATTAPVLDTPAPAATLLPTAAATGAPAAGVLSQLRTILGASADAELRAGIDAAERALAAGDTAAATQTLGTLQRQILQARGNRTISPKTMRAALAAIQEVADRAGLSLPFQTDS